MLPNQPVNKSPKWRARARSRTADRGRCQGLSVIELMIALTLGILVLAGMSQVYLANKKSLSVIDNMGRIQEVGRFGMQFLTRDLRRAGYCGGNADTETILGTLGTAPTVNECAAGSATYGRMVDAPVIGTNDVDTAYGCVSNYLGGDILVARYAAPTPVTTLEAARLYLRTSLFGGRIFAGANSAANLLVGETPQWTFPMVANGYYVSDTGEACGPKALPALSRVSLDSNGVPANEELIPGVEQLQVQYGQDTNNDGSIDQIVNADVVGDWTQTILVRVWLLARSECPEVGHDDNKTYVMGDLVYTPGDNYRRQMYQVTVSLRNSG